MAIQKLCKISSIEKLNTDAVSIWLEAGELAQTAQVGQFVNIKCGEGLLLRRPISICRAEDTRLNVVFEVRGEGTAWLAQRTVGEELDVLGPLGHGFAYPNGKVLVVGGGIGVPPMLNTARKAPKGAIACLGFRGADKAMLLDEFSACCEQVYLASDDGTLGVHGFVASVVDTALSEHPEIQAVLACGPKIMPPRRSTMCPVRSVWRSAWAAALAPAWCVPVRTARASTSTSARTALFLTPRR